MSDQSNNQDMQQPAADQPQEPPADQPSAAEQNASDQITDQDYNKAMDDLEAAGGDEADAEPGEPVSGTQDEHNDSSEELSPEEQVRQGNPYPAAKSRSRQPTTGDSTSVGGNTSGASEDLDPTGSVGYGSESGAKQS